jgi:hypothetical protein
MNMRSPLDINMRSPLDIAKFLESQPLILSILKPVEALSIEDCWVGAGLIRNAVWDHLHGRPAELSSDGDVDVVYFDPGNATPERDIAIEKQLCEERADIPWSVHNQARMHERNGDAPYRNTEDAIRCWPETATAIAARLRGTHVEVLAPHGVEDLVNLVVRPTPVFAQKQSIYSARISSKDWARRWPGLCFRAD